MSRTSPNRDASARAREPRNTADKQPRLVRVAGRPVWSIYDPRTQKRASTGQTDRARAEQVLAAFLAEPPDTGASPATVEQVLDAHTKAVAAARGEAAGERKRWAHRPIKRHLGHRLPGTLREADAAAYVAAREGEGMAAWTIRTEIQSALAAFHWAAHPERAMIPAAPAWTLPPVPPGRVRWLTRDEAGRLLAAAAKHPHLSLFIRLGLGTAARKGALLALTWDRVDFENGTVDLREPGRIATKKRRTAIRVNAGLLDVLREAHKRRTCAHVVEWSGKPVANIKTAFNEAARAAGLPGVTPHCLRHTAISWALQSGATIWEVARFAAATPEVIESVYAHHRPDHLRTVADALALEV